MDKEKESEIIYDEDKVREYISNLTLVSPLHIVLTSNGYGEFPDGYKLTEKGVEHIINQYKRSLYGN